MKRRLPIASSATVARSTVSRRRRVVVTGASTGIGEATVIALREKGWDVIAIARRADRLADLAKRTGCRWYACDLRDAAAVADIADAILEKGHVDALVNNAGGALGVDSIADANPEDWLEMYQRNVMTALHMTRAFLPSMRASGGSIVFLTSTAAHDTYPGGGGYVAAKHAERIIANTLRQEVVADPVRIIEIAPGMVHTPEFSLNRLGSQEAAEKVYEGVPNPLVAEDIAEAITWALTLPAHVNIDSMIVRPRVQATNTLVHREPVPTQRARRAGQRTTKGKKTQG